MGDIGLWGRRHEGVGSSRNGGVGLETWECGVGDMRVCGGDMGVGSSRYGSVGKETWVWVVVGMEVWGRRHGSVG